MNEWCGTMMEWYWQGKTEVLGEKQYTARVVDEWMSMEQWWNDTDRVKPKYSEKTDSLCLLVHLKSYTDLTRFKPRRLFGVIPATAA